MLINFENVRKPETSVFAWFSVKLRKRFYLDTELASNFLGFENEIAT